MQSEIRQCEKCEQSFTIEPDDFAYYKKIGVLVPKLCPVCRARLRLTFRNERFFYHRKCDSCGKEMITMYNSDKSFPVWCHECWWSDKLDAEDYGLEYDHAKPFFDQVKELWNKVPKLGMVSTNGETSSFLNYAADNKNCYMIIECSNNENCINCYWIQLSKDLTDCSFTQNVELSYEVDDSYDSSGLQYSKGCYNCLDSAFLMDCRGCSHCLGCVNQRNRQYYIFNRPYSKEEYEKKLESLRLDTHSGVEEFKRRFADFVKDKPRKFAEITNVINSTGTYLKDVKNVKNCFHSYTAEDCANSEHVWREAKDCVDCSTAGRSAELVFNTLNTGLGAFDVICGSMCWGSQHMEYSVYCPSSQYCLGCTGAKNKKYCILNKQYSKGEYEKLRAEIVARLKKEEIYGDFFPAELSPFGYNESSAIDEFPLEKEEAIAQGFKWEDAERGTYGKETINWDNFPDSIRDLPKDFNVNKEVFVCVKCKKNYRVIGNELAFYRRMGIPVPRECPECRHVRRFRARGPNKLWRRQCMCNKENHGHKGVCPNEFETNYAPKGPDIIYCESCYNKEVY